MAKMAWALQWPHHTPCYTKQARHWHGDSKHVGFGIWHLAFVFGIGTVLGFRIDFGFGVWCWQRQHRRRSLTANAEISLSIFSFEVHVFLPHNCAFHLDPELCQIPSTVVLGIGIGFGNWHRHSIPLQPQHQQIQVCHPKATATETDRCCLGKRAAMRIKMRMQRPCCFNLTAVRSRNRRMTPSHRTNSKVNHSLAVALALALAMCSR